MVSGAVPQPPSFPSRVELVMVDVVVTDKAGEPVPDLTAADFALAEEGRPQRIVSFQSVGSAVSAEGTPDAAAEPKSPQGAPGQVFLIVFDDVHMEPLQTTAAQAAIERFLLSGVQPSDTVAILAPGAEVQLVSGRGTDRSGLLPGVQRLRGLKIVDPCQRLTEFEAMRLVVFGADTTPVRRSSAFRENTACRGGSLDAQAIYEQAQRRDSQTLAAIAAAFPAFRDAEGKRSVILVSSGFVDDPSLRAAFNAVLRRSLERGVPRNRRRRLRHRRRSSRRPAPRPATGAPPSAKSSRRTRLPRRRRPPKAPRPTRVGPSPPAAGRSRCGIPRRRRPRARQGRRGRRLPFALALQVASSLVPSSLGSQGSRRDRHDHTRVSRQGRAALVSHPEDEVSRLRLLDLRRNDPDGRRVLGAGRSRPERSPLHDRGTRSGSGCRRPGPMLLGR